ncbi:hypothetical protein [Sphingomicrobium clamense]|uniref:Uncharacterized protein n=1 Tax=Sphingomicrobium clamense TaxID=2851013 RepID=A0ABS6V5U5_9SPHN|nr:hypothetical protein [Sphingomicrobium sp. B8]MBW0144936.1 hypothetical protein [Sphingomicrobium sp. B8]
MALAALVGAYETSSDGGLRALVPLAGRPLADFQVRSLVAVGAAPIVLLGDDPPEDLVRLTDQLRSEGLPVVLATNASEAAARFESGHALLLVADGIAPDLADLHRLAEASAPMILTVPDDEAHEEYERIDLESRWSGLARLTGEDVGATAAMLGDWDLPSTLLRRAVQAGAQQRPVGENEPVLVDGAADATRFSDGLLAASRKARVDWVARWVTTTIEEWLTVKLSGMRARPALVAMLTPALLAAATAAFVMGQGVLAVLFMLLSIPFDLVGRRIASLRLNPILPGKAGEVATWPLFLASLAALSLFVAGREEGYWPFAVGVGLVAIAHFGKVIRSLRGVVTGDVFAFRRRPACLLLVPFALGGWWTAGLLTLGGYALLSALWLAHGRES